MRRQAQAIPGLVMLFAGVALIVHGPIRQPADYHAFADQVSWFGIPHARDVLSNVAFAAVAVWAWFVTRRLPPAAEAPARDLFVLSLALAAIGSAYYHWAPDNARLVFDRLPIAIACAALLAAAHARIHGGRIPGMLAVLLAVAVGSVAWWGWTESIGRGDLRPYLLLQGAPMVLVPMWQWLHREPARERILLGGAVALYAAAKGLELADAPVLEATGLVSGHTVKHVLGAAAAACIVRMFCLPRDVSRP